MLSSQASGKKEFRCPFCNSVYHNLGNFKQHMRFHESEAAKEERSAMMNEMVRLAYNNHTNVYTCLICKSTYSHPGNFKQHLGKHERETGAVTAIFHQRQEANRENPDLTSFTSPIKSNASNNSHLSNALQSAFADRVDNGDAVSKQYK